MKFTLLALSLLLPSALGFNSNVPSFNIGSPAASSLHWSSCRVGRKDTSLSLIGGAIRKMREEDAKKKMPMASDKEREKEAPGLRVGSEAWKWPPVYPYEEDLFMRPDEEEAMPSALDAAMGKAAEPAGDMEAKIKASKESSDAFWGDEPKTVMDEGAIAKLTAHFEFYLKPGMDVLELGASDNSYFPTGLALNSHVGVSKTTQRMKNNPSLTDMLTADLNDVNPEMGINSDTLNALPPNSFDVVVMTNTVDFLKNPREVFRTANVMLKPDGLLIVPFSGKPGYSDAFAAQQTFMWRKYNDDQLMWVIGSFFKFSADDGWAGLKGFDISPVKPKTFIEEKFGKGWPMFVVQASKVAAKTEIDSEDVEGSFSSMLWMTPVLEYRDKVLISPRLARAWEAADDQGRKDKIVENLKALPEVYKSLSKMDSFAFPFNLQAQLAANLAYEPTFTASDPQVKALRMGLGLESADDFWSAVGLKTSAMDPEDKVSLLAYIVPRFGTGMDERLESFVTGLDATISVVKSKCPGMNDSDAQLAASEMLASEFLDGDSTRSEFADWVSGMDEDDVSAILTRRKSYKAMAEAELKAYRDEKARAEKEREAMLEEMRKQEEKAREERSMVFNEETGKFEEVDPKD